MKKFDLQMFAEAVSGKKIVYLYRILSTATSKAAAALAFTTENSRTKSKDADTTETKDGLAGVQLANAMHLSSWLDKSVTLPIDDELFYEELKKRIAVSKVRTVVNDDKVEAQG